MRHVLPFSFQESNPSREDVHVRNMVWTFTRFTREKLSIFGFFSTVLFLMTNGLHSTGASFAAEPFHEGDIPAM